MENTILDFYNRISETKQYPSGGYYASHTEKITEQITIEGENEVLDYMNGKYTLNDVYKQIQNKNCPLSKRIREYVLSHYNENGEFLEKD